MANIKISALPQYSALTDADIWFVVNNSGETETFKIQLKEFLGLVNGTGLNSLESASFLTGTAADAQNEGSIAIGNGSQSTGDFAVALGNSSQALGEDSVALGNGARSNNQGGTALGQGSIVEGDNGVAIGRNATAEGIFSIAIGQNSTTASAQNGISIGDGLSNPMIYGLNVGGSGNTFSIGGNLTGEGSSIIGSFDSTINSDGRGNAIYNSQSSSIGSAVSGATMIGTQSRVADTDDTTYVENLRTFGQYYSNGSLSTGSTITIDFNNGNIHHIEVSGNLDLTLDNVKNGGRYVIITTTTGAYSINSKTASGFTFKVDSGFDTLGTSETHKLVLDVIGDVIYGTSSSNLV